MSNITVDFLSTPNPGLAVTVNSDRGIALFSEVIKAGILSLQNESGPDAHEAVRIGKDLLVGIACSVPLFIRRIVDGE